MRLNVRKGREGVSEGEIEGRRRKGRKECMASGMIVREEP